MLWKGLCAGPVDMCLLGFHDKLCWWGGKRPHTWIFAMLRELAIFFFFIIFIIIIIISFFVFGWGSSLMEFVS